MDTSDFEIGALFTMDGKSVWKLESFCMSPSCRLKNLETGEIEGFGMDGHTARSYHKISMPKAIEKKKALDNMKESPAPAYRGEGRRFA